MLSLEHDMQKTLLFTYHKPRSSLEQWMSVMDTAESQHLLLRQHRSMTCDFKVLATWEAYLPGQGAQLKTGDHSVYYMILMC